MKIIINFLLILLLIFTIYGCGANVPPREGIPNNAVSEIKEGSARIYFYHGTYTTGQGSLIGPTIRKATTPGNIYLNNVKIGYINKGEVISVDVNSGIYELSWIPIDYDSSDSFFEVRKNINIINISEGYSYFQCEWEDSSNKASKSFGAVGALSGSRHDTFVIENKTNGMQDIKGLKLTFYEDLSEVVTPKGKSIDNELDSDNNIEKRMKDLKHMFDSNLITKEEYDKKRKQLLDEL